MASLLKKTLLSTTFFAIGYGSFASAWPAGSLKKRELDGQRTDIINEIQESRSYKEIATNAHYESDVHSSRIPKPYRPHMVSQGLLFGPDHLEIDPIVFINRKDRELQAYYHLGKNLTSTDGVIHNGVLSTILDESLTFCGFPLLPSGRGVTAKLSIDFLEHAPPDSTVVLKAKVKEHKGRKVVIDGYLETLDSKPLKLAKAECILVEPKWFKYFKWLQLF